MPLSLLNPWSRVVQQRKPVHVPFFPQPQPVLRTMTGRPTATFQFFSVMLRCELAVAPDHSGTPRTPFLGPVVRSLPFEGRSSPLCFPSTLLQVSEAPPLQASPVRLEGRMHCHCHLETTSQSECSIRVPSLRLRNSPDVRCACLHR